MEQLKKYLRELTEWAEQMKGKLEHVRITADEKERWKAIIEDWQKEIGTLLDDKAPAAKEKLYVLHREGERIFNAILNKGKAEQTIPYGRHELPPLPYSYDALEPYISEEIMRLHHDKHHRSYVEGLNKAERALYREMPSSEIKHWLREQAFHGSGHQLHTIFWNNMTPHSSKHPVKELTHRINVDFGSFATFKELFTKAAASVEGVGWAILFWDVENNRLGVQTFEKHQLFQVANTIPLLVLDMWEHAYYLQYKTDKETYITNWWNVVNWEDVNDRYKHARGIK